MHNLQVSPINNILFLETMIKKEGPHPFEYQEMDEWYNTVWDQYKNGDLSDNQIEELRKVFSVVYDNPKSMFGLVFLAPYGYKGDFEIIDRIYQQHICPSEQLSKWDSYFQRLSASKAVRNRKEYLNL